MTEPAHAARQRAQALIELGRFDAAADAARQALSGDPNDAQALCLLAQSYLGLERWPDAVVAAEVAAGVRPWDDWPQRLRSVGLARMGRKDEAMAAACEALRIAPTSTLCMAVLADRQLDAHQLAAAEKTLAELARLAPDEAGTHLRLGLLELRRRRWRAAEHCFRKALTIDPENSAALNNLGVVLKRLGYRREAVHYFAQASRLDPNDSTARRNAVNASKLAGGGVLIYVLLQLVRLVDHPMSSVVFGLVVVVLVVLAASRWRRWVRPRNDPKASRELMRQLARERRSRRRGLRFRR